MAVLMRRSRVSGFLTLSTASTCLRLLLCVRQAVVRGPDGRVGVQSTSKIRWLDHGRGFGVDFDLDVDSVALADTGGLTVGAVTTSSGISSPRTATPRLI